MLDPIRSRNMHDERVMWWYRQKSGNVCLAEAMLSAKPELRAQADADASKDLQWVHVQMVDRYRSLGCGMRLGRCGG